MSIFITWLWLRSPIIVGIILLVIAHRVYIVTITQALHKNILALVQFDLLLLLQVFVRAHPFHPSRPVPYRAANDQLETTATVYTNRAYLTSTTPRTRFEMYCCSWIINTTYSKTILYCSARLYRSTPAVSSTYFRCSVMFRLPREMNMDWNGKGLHYPPRVEGPIPTPHS